jgi:hypothetical protein
MKQYIVTGRSLDLPAGVVVELTPDQYRRRKHFVAPVQKLPDTWDRAAFTASAAIQFKNGELVRTDHDLGKALVQIVVPVKEGCDPDLAAETEKKLTPPREEKRKKTFSQGK